MKKKSNLEELFAVQLRALKLPDPTREYKFLPHRKFRFDFAWLAEKLAVEVEGGSWSGGRHVRGTGFHSDCWKYDLAVMDGWKVLRGDSKMVKDGSLVRFVEQFFEGRI